LKWSSTFWISDVLNFWQSENRRSDPFSHILLPFFVFASFLTVTWSYLDPLTKNISCLKNYFLCLIIFFFFFVMSCSHLLLHEVLKFWTGSEKKNFIHFLGVYLTIKCKKSFLKNVSLSFVLFCEVFSSLYIKTTF
jgi:hypothetical protein